MIRFEQASFSYDGRVRVIDRAEAELGPGLTLCLGLNGCGKSTLLKLAAGVEHPDEGRILLGGRDLWSDEVAARRTLAYLPEHPDLTPFATIGDILRMVCRLRGEAPGRASEALEAMDNRIAEVILSWIGDRVTDGAAVVVVSHTLAPFAEAAARAVTIERGTVRVSELPPQSSEERRKVLDGLAKGAPVQARTA